MRTTSLTLLILLLLGLSGCTALGEKHTIKLESEVTPSKVSLDEPEDIVVKAKTTNIADKMVTVEVNVVETEGLNITRPKKTTFRLKPGESRIVEFRVSLNEDAVPGDYRIDVQAKTTEGDVVLDKAKLRVYRKKALL
ncbi:MAG: hypothetical protein GXO66_05305 [Euryarchaeota archaeon]|nr:hypothetical protein [Euryarchaeota archaeon]